MMTITTAQRVTDLDRRRTTSCLTQALAQGYLQFDEYDLRVQLVFRAQTPEELRNLLSDLPVDRIRRGDPGRQVARIDAARHRFRVQLSVLVGILSTLLVIWSAVTATTDTLYFWPVLGAAVGYFIHAMAVPQPRKAL